MNLNRLGFKLKIAVGFGSLLAIIALMSFVGYHTAALNEALANEMQANSAKKDIILVMQQSILVQRLGTRDILMGRGDESTKLLENGQADFRRTMDELAPLLTSDADRRLYAAIEVANLNFTVRNERVLAVYRASGEAAATQMYKGHDGLVLSNAFAGAIGDLMDAFERRRLNALSRQEASDRRARTTMPLLATIGLVFGSVLATLIARSIVSAVDRMLRMIEAVASNDLTVADMQVETADEIGKAGLGLNKMKNNLRDVILSIASTAQDVAGSSREISAAASQSASSAEEQKQQVQQVAATMEQMAATVREVSRHSNTAAQSANSAADSARDGGLVVEGVIERMRGIALSVRESAANVENLGARSHQIGRAVGVIDEIARQTSLLALNAAIEAARAGEQGRGFAVVAGEVRRLADRTSAATKEIASVIQGLQATTAAAVEQIRSCNAAVEQGVEITSHAGDSIQRIIREAETAGSLVAQIAAAAGQQATATREVTGSMGQISNLATESAAGAGSSARACEQLFTLASGLQNMVDRFDLDRAPVRTPVRSGVRPTARPGHRLAAPTLKPA